MKKGLSRQAAAEFLRRLAADVAKPTAADLYLVADYIEEKDGLKWRRGKQESAYWRQQIALMAVMVDARHGRPLSAELDKWARALATRMGRTTPEEEQKLREQIEVTRKRIHKAKSEK